MEKTLVAVEERLPDLLRSARKAQAVWGSLPLDERREALGRARDRLLTRGAEASALLLEEIGKPPAETLTAEVAANIDLFDYWISAAPGLLAPERVGLSPLNYPKKKAVLERLPVGVVGLIAPWNFPIALPLRTIVPALLAGNAVIFKPSEVTPRAGAFVVSLFSDLLPPGLLSLFEGGPDAGEALSRSAVDRIVFTGSVAAGKKVASAAAQNLTPCSLELGGKDAAIVLADCDLSRTSAGLVWGSFYNAGQNCASIERVFVEKEIAPALLDAIVARTKALTTGPGGDLPPLATERQLAHVSSLVEDALKRGAKALTGGKAAGQSRFYEPTVLTDVPEGARILDEETFGPVMPFVVVADAEEAVRRANACRYGLTGSVWTQDLSRGEALARRLETGIATVNNHSFTGAIPQLPWTGVKLTGTGITSSKHALSAFTRPRTVLVDQGTANGAGSGEIWWYPYTATLEALASGSLLLARRGLLDKARAIVKLLPLLGRRKKEIGA